MAIHLGDVPANSTLYIPFASYGKTNGESITLTGLAQTDIECFKNGSTTQRTSDNGISLLDTDGTDFDSIVGLHGFSIDLSDNSDSGFWSVGGFYWIVISSVTIDSQTVSFIAATFRIVAAEAIAGKPKVDVDALLGTAWLTPAVAGTPDVNAKQISGDGTAADTLELFAEALDQSTGQIDNGTFAAGAIDNAAIAPDAIGSSELAASAVTEIQSGLATAAAQTTAQNDLDILTGTDGVTLATSQPNYAPLKASDYRDPVSETGTITAVNSSFEFETDLTEINSYGKDMLLVITPTGMTKRCSVPIKAYDQANGTIYLANGDGLPINPTVGDTFEIWIFHAHAITDIASETAQSVLSDANTWPAGQIGGLISNASTKADAIVADTNELQTDWANGGRLDLLIDAILADTAALEAAQSEPGQGTPAANATPLEKLAYVYKAWRNRTTQTSTTYSLYNDDATTVDQKATMSDDGTTFGKTEITTGP